MEVQKWGLSVPAEVLEPLLQVGVGVGQCSSSLSCPPFPCCQRPPWWGQSCGEEEGGTEGKKSGGGGNREQKVRANIFPTPPLLPSLQPP